MKKRTQNLPAKASAHKFFLVGLGASAGGVQALQQFFRHIPPNPGIAYVVILHLSPNYDSKLTEILQQVSTIPVQRVTEKVKVQPNRAYVVSPNQHLVMSDGHIVPTPNMEEEDRRAPVDIFFRTLADNYGPKAVCVVLSGTGANGSMGLKRVKEMGGATFVQNPREAQYNEMPRNSIATDLVDEVLNAAEMPERILEYVKQVDTIHIPIETDKRADGQQQALREVFTHLRVRTGHDFSNYKRPTLLRRIERRINICKQTDLQGYSRFVAENPDEVNALLKDLLISVTNFYRDKRAFDLMENEVIPSILRKKKAEEQLRIWVPACATGEEAYSLAMILAEKTLNVIDAPRIQIFATDIDEAAIAFAREGLYSINDAADVSPERLRRFFNKEGDLYRIRREVREMILFANHNFIKDPPFSHLDLVSCRNVLIYLNQTAQERVLETFHFALKPGGFLFLGLSESAESASDLFATFNREFHVFQTRPVSLKTYPLPESVPTFQHSQQVTTTNLPTSTEQVRERMTIGDLHQQMLEQYAPPSLIVNQEYNIIHLSERAGKYLHISGGEPSQNLLKIVRPELRLELRSALYQSVQRQTAVDAKGLRVNVDGATEVINIHVRPVFRHGDAAHGFILVVFEQTLEAMEEVQVVQSTDEPVTQQLEEELIRVKSQLRASIEQHEFQAEELKASNEELQAMNEELRSAAEELETSKEELQSINEELRTVNQELKVKVEETTTASNNLQNLINSVDIGTIFLDRSFRVALFTPPARSLFNLIPNDIGRPLSDITHKLQYDNVIRDAELVLERLITIEKEVQATDGQQFMTRILPYRTEEDRINGVVLTFFNITQRKKSESSLRESEERFRAIISQTTAGIVQAELSGKFILVNNKFCDMLGYGESELLSKLITDLTFDDDRSEVNDRFEQLQKKGIPFDIENRLVRKGGDICWVAVSVSAILDSGGEPASVVAVYHDITERKALEEQKDEFIGIAGHELKTPVTSIKAYAEVLQEKFDKVGDTKNGSLMTKLNGQLDRLTLLIRDLLDTTKIAEGKLELRLEKFNLVTFMNERIEELQRLSERHTIKFKADKLRPVEADKERVGQVLTNIVANALKYSPEGETITIVVSAIDKGVKVTIADKGIGIDSKLKDRIFDRFFRVKDSKTPSSGMGLGLYISAAIIHRHNGTIGVNSKPGKGSTFYFTLPLSQPKSAGNLNRLITTKP